MDKYPIEVQQNIDNLTSKGYELLDVVNTNSGSYQIIYKCSDSNNFIIHDFYYWDKGAMFSIRLDADMPRECTIDHSMMFVSEDMVELMHSCISEEDD